MPKHIEHNALLYVDGVNVSFDGFKALNNLSLIMRPGEMQAIIGPNGAGKTTMMDVITGKIQSLFFKMNRGQAARIDEIIALVRLETQRDALAGSLSHGQKQWLEIGMLLIQDPDVLLIDEPAAGMTDAETERTAELFRELAKTYSLVVVEHDMAFIEALDCRVIVLHEGTVLAEGSLSQVKANPRVVEVYLGR